MLYHGRFGFGWTTVLVVLGCIGQYPIKAKVDNDEMVTVEFYGESECPYCRNFVRNVWPTVWEDKELMQYVKYDFVAWGNSYFSIPKCSSNSEDSYDRDDRACWYKECIDGKEGALDGDCFAGDVIYQHSEEEGQIDIYEMCVKLHYGLEVAVNFAFCCEGPNMDDLDSPYDILLACNENINPDVIQECFEKHGHIVEVWAAKHTPSHPSVPYVLVDGKALDDPFAVQKAICDRLIQKLRKEGSKENSHLSLPKACTTTRQEDIDEWR